MTLSIVAIVVVATGRCFCNWARICPNSAGPIGQSTFKISISPSVGCDSRVVPFSQRVPQVALVTRLRF